MKILGVAITPPVFQASGGVSAGIQLMKRVATRVPTEMLVMAEADETQIDEALKLHKIAATNILGTSRPFGPLRSFHTLMWRANFRKWLDHLKPDLVHIHNPHPPGAFAQLAYEADRSGIPYVISTHGYVEFEDYASAFGAAVWQRPMIDWLVRRPLKNVSQRAARIAMLSPEEAPLMARLGISFNRLETITNGVDPWFLDPFSDQKCNDLLARFHVDRDKPVIFFVGNHTPNKGIDTLLRAVMQMEVPANVIIGGGIRSTIEHELLLKNVGYISTDTVNPVTFTGFLNRDELKALYQACDIFAYPSRADTLPLVILEAMVSCCAVVSTTVGGIPYQVSDQSGILIDPGDANALAATLDELASDLDRCKAMGEAGRERALDIFNWEHSADNAVRIYRDILSK